MSITKKIGNGLKTLFEYANGTPNKEKIIAASLKNGGAFDAEEVADYFESKTVEKTGAAVAIGLGGSWAIGTGVGLVTSVPVLGGIVGVVAGPVGWIGMIACLGYGGYRAYRSVATGRADAEQKAIAVRDEIKGLLAAPKKKLG